MASLPELTHDLAEFLEKTKEQPPDRERDAWLAGRLSPCFFLHGDEPFLGRRFLDVLKNLLTPLDSRDFNLDKFWMDEADWSEVIDAARTAPTFFSPWRLTVAEFLLRSADRFKDRDEDKLSDVEIKLLDDYFCRPLTLPGTVLVVFYPSLNWKYKQSPVFKYFSAMAGKRRSRSAADGRPTGARGQVVDMEMKKLRERRNPRIKEMILADWMEIELKKKELSMAPEARARLIQVVGNDLQRLSVEMDKLRAFAGEKGAGAALNAEDIDRLSAWTKETEGWSLTDALESADWPRCSEVLDKLFQEGEEGLKILSNIVGFFQEVQLAKAWLQEKSKDRREVFSTLRPRIEERFGNWYEQKFRSFFKPVEILSRAELHRLLLGLGRIDAVLKSSDAAPRPLIESFVFDYCRGMGEAPVRRSPGD